MPYHHRCKKCDSILFTVGDRPARFCMTPSCSMFTRAVDVTQEEEHALWLPESYFTDVVAQHERAGRFA